MEAMHGPADVVVVGGGPAGLAAALWAARYRRRVVLVDAGEQRNRSTAASHGYLGLDGIAPVEFLERAHRDLSDYANSRTKRAHVLNVEGDEGGFGLKLETGEYLQACRLVLAPGVTDVFPHIDGFFEHFGVDVFTCGSCDGYESQDKTVAVLGHTAAAVGFALGLLDWSRSIALVTNGQRLEGGDETRRVLECHGVRLVEDGARAFIGRRGDLRGVRLRSGRTMSCQTAFFTIGHQVRSALFEQLGCVVNGEGCVIVDEHQLTSVPGVYAAGDVTPGPHLVQVAAAKGAIAGIAAAESLRGGRGAPTSPRPAPDPEATPAGHPPAP